MKNKKIIEFARSQGYDKVLPLGTWRGYTIYEPTFKEKGPWYIGPPLIILVSGDTIRMSTVDEAHEQIQDLIDD